MSAALRILLLFQGRSVCSTFGFNDAAHVPGWHATVTTGAPSACSLLLSSRMNSTLHSLLWPCKSQHSTTCHGTAQSGERNIVSACERCYPSALQPKAHQHEHCGALAAGRPCATAEAAYATSK